MRIMKMPAVTRNLRLSSRYCSFLVPVLFLAACGGEAAPSDAAPTASATSKPTAAAATATAASSATSTAAAAVTSAAATAAAAPAAPTEEPKVEDWEAAKIDLTLLGGSDTGCVARRIREWVRVGCSKGQSKSGDPQSIQVVKGFAASKISILTERNGTIMLVFPAQAGLDAEASFIFADASFRFTVSWPAGQPEPKPLGSFASVGSPSTLSGSPTVSKDPLPDEPALEGAPKDW